MNLRRTLSALAVLAAFAAGNAGAATTTDSFTVTIQVQNNCSIVVGDISFGSVNTLATAHTASSTAAVTCSGNGAWTVAFGAGGSGDQTARRMTDGTNNVTYNLYNAATAGSVLGNGAGATVTPGGTGNGSFTVHARTTAGQPMNNGTFTDTIVATLTY